MQDAIVILTQYWEGKKNAACRKSQATVKRGRTVVCTFNPLGLWFSFLPSFHPFPSPYPRKFLLCVLTISLASSISRPAALSVCFFGSRKKTFFGRTSWVWKEKGSCVSLTTALTKSESILRWSTRNFFFFFVFSREGEDCFCCAPWRAVLHCFVWEQEEWLPG